MVSHTWYTHQTAKLIQVTANTADWQVLYLAAAAVRLCKNKKIAILALTPTLNLTWTLTLTFILTQTHNLT